MPYQGDEVSIHPTCDPCSAECLGPFTVVARSGRGTVQTYLTREELSDLARACLELLA